MTREEYLENLIINKFKSVRSFAEYADVPYTTVRSILQRGVGNAKVENILKITEALGITTDDLLKYDEKSNDQLLAAHLDANLSAEELKKIKEYIKKLRNED